jgi:signal transduction histidine kinase/HPt (histidine-containing phosphotransfer) domain-containing protein/ActR/RegA family two-component response regulator
MAMLVPDQRPTTVADPAAPHHDLLVELLSSEALRTGTLVDALKILSRAACTSLGVDRVSVAVRDAELDELVFAEAYVAAAAAHSPPFLASGVEPLTVFKFAEAGVPLVADDVTTHPALTPFVDLIFRPVDIRALMQVPVDVNGRMIGVFNISVCGRAWHWTDAQIKTGMAIANLAALVIERHGRRHVVALRSAAEERLEAQQTALSHLMRENSQTGRSLEQELRTLSEVTATTLGIERVSIWRLQQDNSAIVASDIHDARDGSHASGVALLRKDHSAYFDAVLSSGMLVVNDIKSDPRTESFVSGYVAATGVTALLDMAIVTNQRTIGVVCIETCKPHVAWTEEQKLFAASVTNLAALAIERHERLRAEAGARETSRRLSSHFTAVNAIMQSDVLHRGGFEDAMRHLSRALCQEIRADGVALDIADAGDTPAYAETYTLDRDTHTQPTHDHAALSGMTAPLPAADREGLTEHPHGYSLRVPVRFHGEIVGCVHAWTNRRDNTWGSGELLMASIIAHLTTLVLERQNRLRIERNLRHANRAAEDASRAKSQFLANMSHEIRTPMNGVFGMTDLLQQTPLTERQHQIVGTIQQSTASLLTIINDILDISRIESGRVELDAKPFELNACINGAVDLFAEEAKRKSIDLTVEIAPTCPAWVLGDTARLRQVCVNLLGNALKFTVAGTIALRVAGTPAADGKIQLRFSITDTGIGIDPSVKQRLFHPFTQADGSITRRFGGTGLGLSISRSLIEMMGGSVSIDSEPGAGTTVHFDTYLKVAAAPTTAESSTATLTAWFAGASSTNANSTDKSLQPAKLQRRFNGHVLVAEDNLVNQEVTRELVGALGCSVTCVENGAAAVQAFEQQSFDLVLMDCQMPIMDGLTATRRIREIEAKRPSARVAIVAVTANAFAEDRHACLDAGMDGYLSKPFNGNQLDTILQRWLPAHLVIERRGTPPRTITPGAGDLPDLDPIVLEPMKRLRTDFYRRLLTTFLRHTPRLVDAIVEAANQRDLAALRLAAHSLKSSSANVGASRMSALARDAEVAASRNTVLDFDQVAADITAAFASVRALFEAELSATEAVPPQAKQA